MHAVAVAEPGLQAQRRYTLSHAWWAAAVVSVGLLFVDVAGHLAHGAPRTTVWASSQLPHPGSRRRCGSGGGGRGEWA